MSKPPSKYPSHCRMQHAGWIGYNHNDWPNDERCPVCRLQDELAAAEAKLAEPCETVCDECLRARRELEAKLADAEKHADELARAFKMVADKLHNFGLTETASVLLSVHAAHAARRAGKAAVEREEDKR